MVTHTRTHVYTRFANPYLLCTMCREFVTGFHDPKRCDCDGDYYITPCKHRVYMDICPSWGPVDGCRCEESLGHRDHPKREELR